MWFFIFLQDMVDTVKPIIEPMISSLKTNKRLFLLGRAGIGKTPLTWACALSISMRISNIYLRVWVDCARVVLKATRRRWRNGAGLFVITDFGEGMVMQPGP